MAEVWTPGTLVEARLRVLRAGLLGPYVEESTRKPKGFASGVDEVTVTYPAGFAMPSIEAVS